MVYNIRGKLLIVRLLEFEQALVSLSQNPTANVEGGNPKAVIIEGGEMAN